MERGEESNCTGDKLDKQDLSQVIKTKIKNDKSCDNMHPGKKKPYPYGLPLKTPWPHSKRKWSNTTNGQSTKCPTSTIQRLIKNKKSQRNCHSQEECKKTWWLNAMCYPVWDPGAEKEY